MVSKPLVSTKLKAVQPRKNHIVRRAIYDRLGLACDSRVILIKGGAGVGKTTLIGAYMKDMGVENVRWLTIEKSDDNVFIFWRYFMEALREFLDDSGQDLFTLFESNTIKDYVDQIVAVLINSLVTDRVIHLIIDDFHHVKDADLISSLDLFIKLAPDNLHLYLLTREMPELYLAKLAVSGNLTIVDEDDLRLTAEESRRFFLDTLNLDLDDVTIERACDMAEGWVGGLQLITPSLCDSRSNPKDLQLRGPNRQMVWEYLQREVLARLSESELDFLIKTSVLPYFDETISSICCPSVKFPLMMQALINKAVLMTCIDEHAGLYRNHSLLGEYLSDVFWSLPSDARSDLLHDAAIAYRKRGDLTEAARCLVSAEDYLEAMKAILDIPQASIVLSFLHQIPLQYMAENVDFAYQRFFYHLANMERDKCQEVYEAIKDKISSDPSFKSFRQAEAFFYDTASIPDFTSYMSLSDYKKLQLADLTKSFLLIKDAALYHIQSRFDDAKRYVEEAMAYGGNNPHVDFFCKSVMAQVLEDSGELVAGLCLYDEMVACNAKSGLTSHQLDQLIVVVGFYLKRLDLENARLFLDRAKEQYPDEVDRASSGYYYNLAEYEFISGATQHAVELVYKLMSVPAYAENTTLFARLLRLYFRIGDMPQEIIERYIADYGKGPKEHHSLDAKLLYADMVSAKGAVSTAHAIVDDLLKHSRKHQLKLKLVEASLLKARLLLEYGNDTAPSSHGDERVPRRIPRNLLREAIHYASADTILLPFKLESKVVAMLLDETPMFTWQGIDEQEAAFLERLYEFCAVSRRAPSEIADPSRETLLSMREVEVLCRLVVGASNKEIADNLCISVATVKTHLINIYSKLHVTNRVTAVEAARSLGYLDRAYPCGCG